MPLARRILDRLRADPARVVSHLVAEDGTAAAVTAASIALPPRSSTASPAAVARGWLVAIAPFGA